MSSLENDLKDVITFAFRRKAYKFEQSIFEALWLQQTDHATLRRTSTTLSKKSTQLQFAANAMDLRHQV